MANWATYILYTIRAQLGGTTATISKYEPAAQLRSHDFPHALKAITAITTANKSHKF